MMEKEILGCILKDNSLINETTITVNQFSNQAYQLLFQSMIKLAHEGKAIDKVTLLAENYQYLEGLGGIDFITQLETIGTVDNFETYEKEFIENYIKKESERITQHWLSNKDRNAEKLITELQKLEEHNLTEFKTKDEVLKDMFDLPYIDGVDAGIKTGLQDLDAILGGFQNTNSYILGARPSMGKTATMLKFALSAMQDGVTPIIFSLEMSKESLMRRLISTVGRINLFFARNPHNLSDLQKKAWQSAINDLYKLDFEIDDTPMQTIQHIRSRIRKEKSKRPNRQLIVFIDYLTLINSKGPFNSEHAKFTDISARLKAIAKEYDCPVITLSQLSRGVEQRNDKRPLLSDLRESGSIEQDADGVMFLYRDSYYNKENEDDTLEIIVAKHRDGGTGTAKVYYNRSTGVMGDLNDTR